MVLLRVGLIIVKTRTLAGQRKETIRTPSDAWIAARNLDQSRAWLEAAENYERCGFGTPKLRYIAKRMRQRIADFEASRVDSPAATAPVAISARERTTTTRDGTIASTRRAQNGRRSAQCADA
jgi:hypothetical protein